MSNPTLIKDLETATEGSRGLSDRVLLVLGLRYGNGVWASDDYGPFDHKFHPTRSLDHAMALDPDDTLQADTDYWQVPTSDEWIAHSLVYSEGGGPGECYIRGLPTREAAIKVLPITRCVAMLEARKEQGDE